MKCKVLRIEEDIDFGCEERQPGAELMSVVLLENEDGTGDQSDGTTTGCCMREILMKVIRSCWMRTVN